ncbi:sensor histidine kinase [Sphingomonas sp. PP-CE-1A-559]|uniref:sensor histidine kinase n=1 Tax=Sphingomonas sp. PP-CE-1A-559 TaxID=2135657 RepID=UPI001FB210DD|nr:sensor histidine kinase [Sphingomonas sp. PP-CE-1A-559]
MPTVGMGRVPATLGRQFGKMRRPASLGAKLVLIMTGVALCGTVAITVLLASIITPSFTKLEDAAISGQVERTRAMLSKYAAGVQAEARDRRDAAGLSEARLAPGSRATPATRSLPADGVADIAANGRIARASWNGPPGSTSSQQWADLLDRTDFALVLGQRRSARFYTRLGNSVAAVGVARMAAASGADTGQGYIAIARVITAKQISEALGVDATLDVGSRSSGVATYRGSSAAIAVPLIGADGRAVATVRFAVPSDATRLGRRVLVFAIAGSIVLLLFVLIMLRRLIAQLVLRPLLRIENHMRRVRASGSLALLEEDERRDEIGSLGRNFNAMLQQLKDLREQIGVQSFDLGRSESAVAVMHNVRNALNPISTILSREIAQVPPIDRATLDRAIDELARGDVSDERRAKLAAFVTAAIDAEVANRESTRHELSIGREAMGHVLEIIGQQQQGAHERPALEICDVTAIIARNATIVRYLDGASIAFGFPAGPDLVMANRLILSQVIGNLFANAAESIVARGTGSGSIVTAIEQGDGNVTIEIRDDGEGITPEVAVTLFHRGFSTRAHKSGGLGLHWCANSVNAMQGSLRLESEGPGQGAVAILTLLAPDAGVVDVG